MMRVLHVYSGNLYGGIEAILATFARHQDADLAHEFALCFDGRLSRELCASGARVHHLGAVRVSRPLSVGRARRALAAVLASGAFDRVVCHATWPLAVFGRTIRDRGIPLVAWVHDVLGGGDWAERWAKRIVPDLIICNSRFTAERARSIFPTAPSTVVYAPVDPFQMSPSDSRTALRRELGTAPDAVVVTIASRLEAWKGHRELLAALGAIRTDRKWACWIVGGAQRPADAEYLDLLRADAQRLRVSERVRFAGERQDVAALLRASDIHCQPNTRPEPFGIVFVEALGAGLPVVTADIGAAPEIIDATCGRLVPPGDADALASALAALIDDPARRASLGAAARLRARALCDPARQLHELAAVLGRMHQTAGA